MYDGSFHTPLSSSLAGELRGFHWGGEHQCAVPSESSQETQMGISHEANATRLLTKQGRQRGHRGLRYHTHCQMVTEGPISSYPITKKVPCSRQPSPLWSLPPCSTSIPPLLSGKGEETEGARTASLPPSL